MFITAMDKFTLYKESYGNDLFRREGWVNNLTKEYITLGEYKARQVHENMNDFQPVYPKEVLEKNRQAWEQLPGYLQLSK